VTAPRITPGGFRETGPTIWAFSRVAGLVTGTRPPHVFTILGRHRRLFWGWLHFAGRLMPGGVLPRHESEMVILRVAHLRGCTYEFEHHRRLGRRAGLSDGQIQALTTDLTDGPWTARELILLTTADALITQRDLDDSQWARLSGELPAMSALEFVLLVGHYDMLATTLITLRVEPDQPSRACRVLQRAAKRNR
jgi:AhpD family alkylhydroperoxidase